jgi:methionine-rich copper-binding protein CopC
LAAAVCKTVAQTGRLAIAIVLGGAILCGCAAQTSGTAAAETKQPDASILASATPAAGSTVSAPVNELKLRFNPPARLDEISVNGPEGLMPVKVTAVGEVADYSIPLAGLGRGTYSVSWKAASGGRDYRGSFAFTVK